MIQPKHNPVCPAILIMIWICACAGAGDTVSISSYGKNYFTLMRFSDYECERLGFSQSSFMSDSTRFRIALAWTLSDRFSLRGAYDVILLMQDSALFENNIFLPGLDTGRVEDFRIGNITPLLLPPHSEDIRSTALCQNADRFFLTADCGFGDIYAGRQAIAWGSGRIINPTDVIQPFSFNTLDTEERIGVDAVRIRIPTGALSEVDTGYVAGKDFKKNSSAFFIRTKNPVASHDVSLLCVGFREHLLLGCDVAGSLGGAGFWIEQAWVLTDMFHRSTRNSADDYYRISFGSDYTFTEKTYTFIDIHYNQPGAG